MAFFLFCPCQDTRNTITDAHRQPQDVLDVFPTECFAYALDVYPQGAGPLAFCRAQGPSISSQSLRAQGPGLRHFVALIIPPSTDAGQGAFGHFIWTFYFGLNEPWPLRAQGVQVLFYRGHFIWTFYGSEIAIKCWTPFLCPCGPCPQNTKMSTLHFIRRTFFGSMKPIAVFEHFEPRRRKG